MSDGATLVAGFLVLGAGVLIGLAIGKSSVAQEPLTVAPCSIPSY